MDLASSVCNWFLACPWWVRYPVDAIAVLFLFFVAILPFGCVHRIAGLERATCKEGRCSFSSLPPMRRRPCRGRTMRRCSFHRWWESRASCWAWDG